MCLENFREAWNFQLRSHWLLELVWYGSPSQNSMFELVQCYTLRFLLLPSFFPFCRDFCSELSLRRMDRIYPARKIHLSITILLISYLFNDLFFISSLYINKSIRSKFYLNVSHLFRGRRI